MNEFVEKAPFIALVDDDRQSAQLLTRMLRAHGAPEIRWYDGAIEGQRQLVSLLSDSAGEHPSLLVVDLKSHSEANADFLRDIGPLAGRANLLMVAMSHTDTQQNRDSLVKAGAVTVFIRHAELAAYRREAASLVSFWARSQRLEAVGM